MSGQQIKFERIPFDVKPKKYIDYLKEKLGVHLSTNVPIGTEVVIKLPEAGKKYHIYYLGEPPEKYAVDGNTLTVCMPKTMLVYLCEDHSKVSHFRVEVYLAR